MEIILMRGDQLHWGAEDFENLGERADQRSARGGLEFLKVGGERSENHFDGWRI